MKLFLSYILLFISFFACGQDKKEPVYLYFNPDESVIFKIQNPGSFIIEGDTVNRMYFLINMGMGIDLCFTNEIMRKNNYISEVPLDSLKSIKIKNYQWILDNYYLYDDPSRPSAYMTLCDEILNVDSTEFFLITPDSLNNMATIRSVLNCNYVEY